MLINKFIDQAEKVVVQVPLCITVPRATLNRLKDLAAIIRKRNRKTNRSKIIQAMIFEFVEETKRPGNLISLKLDYKGAENREPANITISSDVVEQLDDLIETLLTKYPKACTSNVISAIAHYKLDELRI